MCITSQVNAAALEWYSVPADNGQGKGVASALPTPATLPVTPPQASTVTATKPGKPSLLGPAAQQYGPLIADVAAQYAVDPLLMHAVVRAESSYQSDALSHKGAVGLMQVLPATGRRFGKTELNQPRENLEAGAAYLKWLIQRFDGRIDLALAGYNAGEGAVARYADQIPPYAETRQYVSKVLAYYADFKGNASAPRTLFGPVTAPPRLAKHAAPVPNPGWQDMNRLLHLFTSGPKPPQ
ncbi:lytic transglycosylase domain-containing protein [Chitinimonas sp. BJB300]|uniref:lytic transglycosylase domain-containing protein n=1 Tax=Chitinimonas sp. BJB300 TaxID=1559339 RepID=UPI001C91CA34|nr:lytic transglycosylase domain-containing protein [Chitinimonas sp. BJB300]